MTVTPIRPASARLARAALLGVVFVCAACGLVYELALVALGSYLVGDTVGNASLVIGVMVFAMGLGSLMAKRLQRWPAAAFAAVELALALLGGLSVLLLYAAYAWLNLYVPVLVAVSLGIGLLIGAEIPLLMTLLQRIRRQDADQAVADLFAADYVGALVGGLLFPFALLPALGQIRGALAVGAVNAVAGTVVVLWMFARDLGGRGRAAALFATAAVLAVLAAVAAVVEPFQVAARQALYASPVVAAVRTPYQEIVITRSVPVRGDPDVRLYLNGDLQFASRDERRYHEALVHPALADAHRRVLILGGGDGLAAREVLRYPDVAELTEVELDPEMVRLARTDPRLSRLNDAALADPRMHVVVADAFTWLRHAPAGGYDAVLVDMPDPDAVATAKLYSVEFYTLVARMLAPHGRVAVQAGSVTSARAAYWCIEASIGAAGLRTVPYHVTVPSFGGDWGFVLAGAERPELTLSPAAPPLATLDRSSLDAAAVFAPDLTRVFVEPSTLDHPTVLDHRLTGLLDG